MNPIKSLCVTVFLSVGVINFATAAIQVDNLPKEITAAELETMFSRYGKVTKVERDNTISAHTGIVHMGNFLWKEKPLMP